MGGLNIRMLSKALRLPCKLAAPLTPPSISMQPPQGETLRVFPTEGAQLTFWGRVVRAPLFAMMGIPTDSPWWTLGGGDAKPQRGDRRWYIEKSPRDGFRATQLQEWNGSEWRALKLKSEPVPQALVGRLEELNRTPVTTLTPVAAALQRGLTGVSSPALSPAYSPSSPTIVSADVIFANDTILSKMPDGTHVIYLDRGGRIGTSGSPLTLRVGPDPDTGLRRWIVTGQGAVPLPVNLARSLEKLDGEAARVGQVVKMLEGRSGGVLLTTNSKTGAWERFENWVTGWGVSGQYGYDLQLTQPNATVPPRWGVRESCVYSMGGWQKWWSSQSVPLVLAKPLKIANDKLARAFEAKSQTSRGVRLTSEDIDASATIIVEQFNKREMVYGMMEVAKVYVDDKGRVSATKPPSGIYYEVFINRAPSDYGNLWLYSIEAFSDRKRLWSWWDEIHNRSQALALVPEVFPLEVMTQTLEVVQQKSE